MAYIYNGLQVDKLVHHLSDNHMIIMKAKAVEEKSFETTSSLIVLADIYICSNSMVDISLPCLTKFPDQDPLN